MTDPKPEPPKPAPEPPPRAAPEQPAERAHEKPAEHPPEEGLSQKDLFLGLIHSFQAAAMQQMGKVPNPYTDKIERDLRQAKLSIDMLEMIEARTSGNLTGEEARFLKHVLTEVRLNFVAEVNEDKKSSAAPPTPEAPAN